MRVVLCSFAALFGGVYVWHALAASLVGSLVALTLQEFLGAYVCIIMAFAVVSFRRLLHSVAQDDTTSSPVVVSASALGDAAWARALAICLGLPALPALLAASCANQAVRRLRGRAGAGGLVTDRVASALGRCWSSDWLLLLPWVYLWSLALVVSKVTPVLLNVLLVWLRQVMSSWPYPPVVLGVFCLGMVLFLLPPVPGPPIYIFAGMVMSQKCPGGFWQGALSSVALCFALKLCACAVQQKVLGELLGGVHAVKRAVGVHRPFVRAIELILRSEGLSFGKCAVLCGGPDWPTSVLAGILRLSLWQCLLGTCPVCGIIPMSMTGSFLNKRHLDERWYNAGNLMFYVTLLVSVVFWAGSAWAVQEAFDRHGEALRSPRADCVHLDWLDHRAAFVAERSAVKWEESCRAPCAACTCSGPSSPCWWRTTSSRSRGAPASVPCRSPRASAICSGSAPRASCGPRAPPGSRPRWRSTRTRPHGRSAASRTEAHEAAAQQSLRGGEAAEGGASAQPLLGVELAGLPPHAGPRGAATP
ncbi:unnamed protein product [Prorocentrum cordatum]|uniref:Dolichol kinase n=1 Tax=Prorocentrum cordatum TaxID=2364126 RepID=A0ABN9VMT2_9DINO|nr:unnamed protein product [Polarella glacialis]